jgi:pyridoxal phosphate enzyme (YggS family)
MTISLEDEVARRLAAVRQRIRDAALAWRRDPDEVSLLAVSKRQPVAALRAAIAVGQYAFGENYLQEGAEKREALLDQPVIWHFVGAIQSNKTRAVAEGFDWVHTIDRLKIARRLSEQRPAERPPLQCCLQVNVSGESSKSGASPSEVPELAHAIAALPNIRLRGLMTLPEAVTDFDRQRLAFRQLREQQDALIDDGLALDTLSMGMSNDLEAAIAEGATMVRLGTAAFGPRPEQSP